MSALRAQLKTAESKEKALQEDLLKLEAQVKEAQKKEQTQMAILARIKREQAEEAKKAKKLETEAEAKEAEKEAVAEKAEELQKEVEVLRLLALLVQKYKYRRIFFTQALRESRAARETSLAVAAGSKVVLTPQQQASFGACRHGRKEELTELLASDVVHVNCVNEAGNSLLIVAAQNNHKDLCKALHHRGADLDTQNRLGQTALHFAFAFGYTELGKWLVQKGANTNIKNANGMTCYQGLSPAQPAMPFVQRYVK